MTDIDTIISKFKHYHPTTVAETQKAAAVLLLLAVDSVTDEVTILITKRSEKVALYPSDYCLPGGFREEQDQDLLATATREVEEKISLQPKDYEMVAQLDDFADRYGLLVRPFVGMINKELLQNKLKYTDEISHVHFFNLSELDKLIIDHDLENITRRHPSYVYKNQEVIIWGLTASILMHFRNILTGDAKPIGVGSWTSD